jgi:3-hydroxyisobutyrate dehydrogenase/2-hydroxy-3-oxopropionate reductase
MAKLGFIGLGIMGYPMARHLLKAGHDVALWTHSIAKAHELAKEGKGTVCANPKEVAAQSDFVFYCVGDSKMTREVALGKDGLLEGARKGAVIADCSTVAPSTSREIGAQFAAKGAYFLDAPCTGSKPGAENAALTFMVGGDEKAFENAKPYFETMGKRIYYCGGAGQGLQAKLTQNLLLANIMQAFSEGMVLAAKGGIKPELMLDILENSAAKSNFVTFKAPFVLKRDFATNFSAKWMHKDIGLALETAKELDLPLPITSVTQQMFQAAIAKGWGEDDLCGTIRVLEDWGGVKIQGS